MKKYEIAVFITGAVTLSLEVLASRIMTPYFGVSLYIWSGILSITLVFLAIGYRIGGNISLDVALPAVEYRLLGAPIVSALAILLSAIAYPVFFPVFAEIDLIFGSFIGASLLLALPLIALSAMNPLLITLQRNQSKTSDSGAGRVFFISTMGSVIGVIITSFLFIPNLTNFRAILVLAISASALGIVLVLLSKNLPARQRRILLLSGLAVGILSGAVMAGKTSYLDWLASISGGGSSFKITAEYTSMFGNIKVAEVTRGAGSAAVEKYFIQDGLVQNRTDLNNKSISMYTYVLEALVRAYRPDAQDIVVLGLGAGVVPRSFKADGKRVAVVEINAAALTAANENFGFDREGIQIHLEDARTFVRKCDRDYDAAVVDLFLGDSTPDYLLTREFFADLSECLRADGVMVMNAFLDDVNSQASLRLFATIGAAFPRLYLSGIPGGNNFLVGSAAAPPARIAVETVDSSPDIARTVDYALSSSQRIPPRYYADAEPVTDDHNIFGLLFADSNLAMRRFVAGYYPASILVN